MPLLPLWPHADRCGFGHHVPASGLTLTACGPSLLRPLSALPWKHKVRRACPSGRMRSVADSPTVCPPLGSQHASILPLGPHADRCGFRHRLPPLAPTKCYSCAWPHAGRCGFGYRLPPWAHNVPGSCHSGRMRTVAASATVCPPLGPRRTPLATLAASEPLRIPPPSALPWLHKMPPATPATPNPPIVMVKMRIMMMRTMAEEDMETAKGHGGRRRRRRRSGRITTIL